MSNWSVRITLGTATVLMSAAVLATAADVRDGMAVPPDKVFARMLGSAEKGDFSTVGKGLQVLAPLSKHVNQKLSLDVAAGVRRAVSSGDKNQVIRSIHRYMAASMKVLLMECTALGTNAEPIKQKLRFLIKEELVLDPYVRKIDFAAANRLRQLVQQMAQQAGADPQGFRAKASEFQTTLTKAVPFGD